MITLPKKRMLEDGSAFRKEDGELIREYKTTHEENILPRWLRKDLEMMTEEMEKVGKQATEEDKSGKRELEREREGVEVNSERVCFDRSLRLSSRSECAEVFSDLELGNCFNPSFCQH